MNSLEDADSVDIASVISEKPFIILNAKYRIHIGNGCFFDKINYLKNNVPSKENEMLCGEIEPMLFNARCH